jgi:hypothetical protein
LCWLQAPATVNYHSEKAQHTALREQTLRIFARTLIKPCGTAMAPPHAGSWTPWPSSPWCRPCACTQPADNVIASESALDTGLPAQDPAHTNQLAMPLHHRDEQGRDHQVGHLSVQFTPFSMAQAAMQNLGQQLAVFAAMLVVVLLGPPWCSAISSAARWHFRQAITTSAPCAATPARRMPGAAAQRRTVRRGPGL